MIPEADAAENISTLSHLTKALVLDFRTTSVV